MNSAYLNMTADAITAKIRYEGRDRIEQITTREQLDAFVTKYKIVDFWCSSSLDFPHEYTENAELINLANVIRGNV